MNDITIKIPKDYKPVPIPFYNEWIEALQSDKFKQTKGRLFDPATDSYCCLGVLSKVQGRLTDTGLDGEGISPVPHQVLAANNPCVEKYTGSSSPKQTGMSRSGFFPLEAIVVFKGAKYSNLSTLNDYGATFKQIARVIQTLWCAVE